MDLKSFDFYRFLKDVTNQSLNPLQNNSKYDAILRAIANVFSTLYERVQLIKINNTLDLNNDLEYQNYLNNNSGSISQDIILEYVSEYLDTDHFKDTVAVLMRMYEYRANGNQLNNLDKFVEQWIIPSFKFFTMNAGDLHKAKGTQGLLERLFEFYSEVNDGTRMFDGLIEQETEDTRDYRLSKFTSYRVGIDEANLKRNYPNIGALNNIEITKYMELGKHRYVQANGFLFMSEKDRDDWWVVDILDALYKVDDSYYVIQRDDLILLYADDVDMYDDNYDFNAPEWITRESNVEFIPQVVNVTDINGEYHYGNFYWIEKVENNVNTFVDYTYNLKRWKNTGTEVVLQTVQTELGIGFEPLALETNSTSYPRINSILSVDYLWLDFHESSDNSYEFELEDAKMIYTFTYEYQFKKPTGTGGFEYPKHKMLAITRDGYDYNHEVNGFYYKVLMDMNDNNIEHYQLLERSVKSQLDEEIYKLIASETIDIRTVLDLFVVERKVVQVDSYFNMIGYWDADNSDLEPPSTSPNHGDYWIVSNDGNIELNGLDNWRVNDVVVWNANFGYWEKNNDVTRFVDGENVSWAIDHSMIAVCKDLFIPNPGEAVATPKINNKYEENCGMFIMKCSDIPLSIDSWNDIIWVDSNAIETFGPDASLMYCYKDKDHSDRLKVYAVKMSGFFRENDRMDLTRILRNYPINTSILSVYKFEVTDKHIIAYCRDTRNTSLKTMAIILENTNYNIPLELRNNEINMSYDAEVRSRTRDKQPWFRLYDDNGDVIDDEEVQAMKDTLARYATINSNHDSLHALINLGFESQKYDSSANVEDFPVVFPAIKDSGVTKYAKEQSALKIQDSIFIRVDGDPDDVNCDCEDQRSVLYVYDFLPMTLFYDLDTLTPDPSVYGYPTKVELAKRGEQNDEYSGFEDVCRFESDYFYYYYDGGATLPVLVRQKIRLNLYAQFQEFIPYCANSGLRFNWGMHHLIEYDTGFDDGSTFPDSWVTALDEEIYMPVQQYNECNPVGIYYTTNIIDDGSTVGCYLSDLKNPWNVYDIPAAKISLV